VNLFWQAPIVVMSVLAWLAAPPTSLGDAAAREAFRRQMTPKSSATLTNLGQRPEIPPGTFVPPPSATAPPTTAAPPPADGKHDESWWRTRIAAAREAVERDKVFADVLQTKINGLQRDVVNVDNPVLASQKRDELQRSIEHLDKTKAQIADGQKAIGAIEEEARRAGVPPGWIR